MEKIGKLLKEKRLELGMTVEDISSKTRLTQKHIKALEEGDMDFFQDDLSYLRFFVKSYCEAVDIDFEDIKDDLRASVNDYTQTMTLSSLQDHEEIEKSIAQSEKLTKVNSVSDKMDKVRHVHKPKLDMKHRRKVDFSLVSLIAVGAVVVIVIASALVLYMKNDAKPADKNDKQPIVDKQNNKGDYPSSDEKNQAEKEKKELTVTKNTVNQYTLENVNEGDELQFEIYFGGSNSGFSITVDDKVLTDPPAKIYDYQSTVNAKMKAKKDMKIQIYIGWMNAVSMKINGKNVKIDDSIAMSNAQQTLEFVIAGDDSNESAK